MTDRVERFTHPISTGEVSGRGAVETPHPTWQRYAFARKGEVSEVATTLWRETEQNVRPKRRRAS